MRTRVMNVGVLDMRKSTPESVAEIESIRNVGLVIVSPQTRALLPRLTINNMGSLLELDADVKPVMANGMMDLTEEALQGESYLMVNGVLTVRPDVTPESIRRGLTGGMVNGKVRASQSQMGALLAAGVAVNGANLVYPDGLFLRDREAPVTRAEAQAMVIPAYLAHRAVLEAGVPQALEQNDLMLYGGEGVILQAADAEAFHRIWRGEGDVLTLPEGYALLRGQQMVGRREAPLTLRGKRCVVGDLILREDMGEAQLTALEALIVYGRLFVPEALLGRVMALLANEPELVPYSGTFMLVEGMLRLDAALLQETPGQMALWVRDMLTLDADIPPALLREKVSLLYNEGMIQMTTAQRFALMPALINSGDIEQTEEGDETESEPPEKVPDDVRVVGNAAMYVV